MAGKIIQLIKRIISDRSKNDPSLAVFIRTKIALKGINPDKYHPDSEDDPLVIEKLLALAKELHISLNKSYTKQVYSTQKTAEEAVLDIKSQLQNFDPRMLLFFSSPTYNPEVVNRALQSGFAASVVFGCTTAGEIIDGRLFNNSIVAMAFNSEVIEDVKLETIENIKEEDSINKAFRSFEDYYGESAVNMDFSKYVGIILMDGLSMLEERVMDKIGDLTNVIFIGGSAADNLEFIRTSVYGNGKVYHHGAVLALLKPKSKFDIIKTQSFRSLGKTLVATRVNEAAREVLEFNHKPAAQAYAEALGVPVHDISGHFLNHPVGLIVGDDIYVRSPQRLKGDTIIFYCNILEGMEVSLLESIDIVKDTKQAIDAKKAELGNISALINFQCILRTLELQQKGCIQNYESLFAEIPTIGFSTYGEAYVGHINQTSTMLVFA
ncbi:MAG: FIST N-terminal domain-containing protein [Thermacetogeniaceae bacterium]